MDVATHVANHSSTTPAARADRPAHRPPGDGRGPHLADLAQRHRQSLRSGPRRAGWRPPIDAGRPADHEEPRSRQGRIHHHWRRRSSIACPQARPTARQASRRWHSPSTRRPAPYRCSSPSSRSSTISRPRHLPSASASVSPRSHSTPATPRPSCPRRRRHRREAGCRLSRRLQARDGDQHREDRSQPAGHRPHLDRHADGEQPRPRRVPVRRGGAPRHPLARHRRQRQRAGLRPDRRCRRQVQAQRRAAVHSGEDRRAGAGQHLQLGRLCCRSGARRPGRQARNHAFGRASSGA